MDERIRVNLCIVGSINWCYDFLFHPDGQSRTHIVNVVLVPSSLDQHPYAIK